MFLIYASDLKLIFLTWNTIVLDLIGEKKKKKQVLDANKFMSFTTLQNVSEVKAV